MVDLTNKEGEGWLALREASEKMGVSPATLRAWADEGRVLSYRTPGGHRRFRVSEGVTPFQKEKRGGDARWRLLEHSVLGRIQEEQTDAGTGRLPTKARTEWRELERNLVRLATMALYAQAGEVDERAAQLGVSWAKFKWRHGLEAREMLDALGELRRAVVGGVVEFSFGMGEPDVDELNLWLSRVNQVIDRVSVSMLEYRSEDAITNAGK